MRINEARLPRDVVVIAASAGGLEPLRALVASLPTDLAGGVAVVFHRNPFVDGKLLMILQKSSNLPVVEPQSGARFERGKVYLAPRDHHLLLSNGSFMRNRGPKLHYTRPAADMLFCSAAAWYGPRVVGVVLSGGGFDGARGCLAIKAAGGLVLAQDLNDATFPYMPKYAIQQDDVDGILPLPELARVIPELAQGHLVES